MVWNKKESWFFYSQELVINQTKIDERGVRFPDAKSTNISESSEEISSFIELPKQDAKSGKGINKVVSFCR